MNAFAAIRPWLIAEGVVLAALAVAYISTGSNLWLFGLVIAAVGFGSVTAWILVTHKKKSAEAIDAE